jgi:hypothetical protein
MPPSIGCQLGDARQMGTQGRYFFGETGDHLGKTRTFGGGDPLDGESLGIDSAVLQNDSNDLGTGQGFVITFQVMAFTQMSAHDNDAVGPLAESIYHQVRMHHAGAHNAHGAHVGRILQPGHPGQIAARIRAPVAKKSDNGGIVFCWHMDCSFISGCLFLLDRARYALMACRAAVTWARNCS